MRAPQRVRLYAVLTVAFCVLVGCSEQGGGDHVLNEPPTVWLASAPPSGMETGYKVHLYWGGWDPDGEIAYYEYCITDNDAGIFDPADTTTTPDGVSPWYRVWGNDSTFVFSADSLTDSTTVSQVARFERSHTFLIRAVDRDGAASVEAAHRSFTAWTLSPSIVITVPRRQGLTPLQVAPVTTYQWRAVDYGQDLEEAQLPDSVRWILREIEGVDFGGTIDWIRKNQDSPDWYPWHDYNAPGDSGQFWTTPVTDLGAYIFAVQAKDEAGAVTPVFDEDRNVRRVRVAQRNTGPILDVSNEYVGTVRSSVSTPPAVIVDLPAGLPISFSFTANADHYGGLVSGYRYGWDISDLNNPEQWEIDVTPFTNQRGTPTASSPPRTFFFGTHTFDVEVVDNTDSKSRVEVKINIIPFTMKRSLLLVDDFEPQSAGIYVTRGVMPNDEEHDAFWEEMLDDVVGFSMQDDQITVRSRQPLSIVRVADYKSIIWDVMGGYDIRDENQPKLYDLVRYQSKNWTWNGAGKVEPNVLLLFLRAGGHLMLCGHQPMTQAARRAALKYPIILKYELGGDQDGLYVDQIQTGDFVGDESFAYREGCIEVLDLAYFTGYGRLRSQGAYGCPVDLRRSNDPKRDGLRSALPIDPRFPQLELRPEVSSLGNAYHESVAGLNTELYNPPYFSFCIFASLERPRPCFEPIYGNGCLNEDSPLYNAPVAVWSSAYATVVPDIDEGGVAARSVYLGFDPYYFKPAQAKEMLNIILFEEWQLRRF